MQNNNLGTLIPKICVGSYTPQELLEFVSLVQKISLSYLKYQEVIGKHIRWERRDSRTELEDMAMDCVAGLFMRNDKNEFVLLNRYFGPFLETPEKLDPADYLILLRRLIIKKTKQELSRIFKERDPEGAKIVRNIRVAIKNCEDIESFREMGREYVFKPAHLIHSEMESDEDIYLRREKPVMPERELRMRYLEVYNPKDHVSTSIRKMLQVISTDCDYQNALPTDMISRLIRNTNVEMVRARLLAQIDDPSPLDYVHMNEIEEAKKRVLVKVETKIFHQYVAHGKLPEEKGDIYYRTLSDVLDDITHNKKIESYYRHLQKYMPGLTQQQYRSEERTIFEYLGKLTKKWFRDSLKDLV